MRPGCRRNPQHENQETKVHLTPVNSTNHAPVLAETGQLPPGGPEEWSEVDRLQEHVTSLPRCLQLTQHYAISGEVEKQ